MRNNFVMSTNSAMVSIFRSQGLIKAVGNPGSAFTVILVRARTKQWWFAERRIAKFDAQSTHKNKMLKIFSVTEVRFPDSGKSFLMSFVTTFSLG